MGPSEEADCRSSVESPSEKEVRKGHFMAVGSSERLADQFLLLGLPLESEVCKNIPTIILSALTGELTSMQQKMQCRGEKKKMHFCSFAQFSLSAS